MGGVVGGVAGGVAVVVTVGREICNLSVDISRLRIVEGIIPSGLKSSTNSDPPN